MSPRLRLATRLMRAVTMSLMLVGFYFAYRGESIPWLAFAGPLADAGFGPRARNALLLGASVAVGLAGFATDLPRAAPGSGRFRQWLSEAASRSLERPVAAIGLEFAWFLMMLAVLHQAQYGTMS